MIQTPEEYQQSVEQKMQARAERHAREHEAQAAERAQEAQATETALAQTQQAQQLQADVRRQHEAVAEARRNRPTLIAKYKSNPAGVRYVLTLRQVCLRCGSEHTRSRTDHTPHVLVCQECTTEWFASHCWSCATGLVDSRDPETPPCKQCGWPKCAVCSACNQKGCATNPYHAGHRQRDEATASGA